MKNLIDKETAAPAAQTSPPSGGPNLAAEQPNIGGGTAAPKLHREATVAIAGMGLIGGSFFKALEAAGYNVMGFDKGDPVDVRDADLVIVALAPETTVDWICLHAGEFKDGAIVVDVCGVKGFVLDSLREHGALSGRFTFVGGHPMAGKEVSGFANSSASLFRGASMIVTPAADTPDAILDMLRGFFTSIGFARMVLASPDDHDERIAYTSQLCHIISSAYLRDRLSAKSDGFSAGSFRDMIRVGAPDPRLWAELFTLNRDALVPVLNRFIGRLEQFRDSIAANDRKALEGQLAEGRDRKNSLERQSVKV